MTKEFKNIDKQVKLLKERNIVINDKEKEQVKRYLLNNNYYSVINQYSKFFISGKDAKDLYDNNVSFGNIKAVHQFDKAIKRIFLTSIIEVEHQFKSIISYRYTEHFKNDLNSYLKLENYEYSNVDEMNEVRKLINKIDKIILDKQRDPNQNSIKHYINTNSGVVPFWVLSNYLTLGHLVYLYKYLPTRIKENVNKDLSYFVSDNKQDKRTNYINSNTIYLTIENIRQVRNIVAHNNMLLKYKCEYDTPYNADIHQVYNIKNSDNRQDVFNVFVSFQYFLDREQFNNIHNNFRQAINRLKKDINQNYFEDVINSIGFIELDKRHLSIFQYIYQRFINGKKHQ